MAYIGILSNAGKRVEREDALEYAFAQIKASAEERHEFIEWFFTGERTTEDFLEWFYSGNWIEENEEE